MILTRDFDFFSISFGLIAPGLGASKKTSLDGSRGALQSYASTSGCAWDAFYLSNAANAT